MSVPQPGGTSADSAGSASPATARRALVAVLVLVLGVALLVSPFASSEPDGLEKVAEDEGFDGLAEEHAWADGPLADYGVAGIDQEHLSTAVAGLLGVALILGLTYLLSHLVRRGRPEPASG